MSAFDFDEAFNLCASSKICIIRFELFINTWFPRVLTFYFSIVSWNANSGANKRAWCPSCIFWLLWRSMSSWSWLHKQCNWQYSKSSCELRLLASSIQKAKALMLVLIRHQNLLLCHVDSTKSIQAAYGGGG